MGGLLFGDYLSRVVGLGLHDVQEILTEQAISRHRFGQVALALGMCERQHVWQARSAQCAASTPHVDLASAVTDRRAARLLPFTLAARFGVAPVRLTDDGLVVAASEASLGWAAEMLPQLTGRPISFVLATDEQIRDRARASYAPRPACAGRACASRCKGAACGRAARCALERTVSR